MRDGFEQEFYRPQWQRVLPLGPDGIQPYIRTGRSSSLSAASPARRRPLTVLADLARGMIAFQHWAAIGMAKRLPLPATGPRAEQQRPSLGIAPQTARPDTGERTTPPLSRAA
jgi:hypothetical protein